MNKSATRRIVLGVYFSLTLVTNLSVAIAAGWDPKACTASIQSRGFKVCHEPGKDSWPACDIWSSPSMRHWCGTKGAFHAMTKASMAESPDHSQAKVFSDSDTLPAFLEQHPDWKVSDCYCCCP